MTQPDPELARTDRSLYYDRFLTERERRRCEVFTRFDIPSEFQSIVGALLLTVRREELLAFLQHLDFDALEKQLTAAAEAVPFFNLCACGKLFELTSSDRCPSCTEKQLQKRATYKQRAPADMIASALAAARAEHLPATLTSEQWKCTLKHFRNACYLCGEEWHHVEHVTPLKRGGGTTADNCLPACATCNRRKGNLRLEEFPITAENIEQAHSISRTAYCAKSFDMKRVSYALTWLRQHGRAGA